MLFPADILIFCKSTLVKREEFNLSKFVDAISELVWKCMVLAFPSYQDKLKDISFKHKIFRIVGEWMKGDEIISNNKMNSYTFDKLNQWQIEVENTSSPVVRNSNKAHSPKNVRYRMKNRLKMLLEKIDGILFRSKLFLFGSFAIIACK